MNQPTNMRELRQSCIQFFYQCEAEKIFYFSKNHLNSFIKNFSVSEEIKDLLQIYCEGILNHLSELDEKITKCSKNWQIDRMPAMDRFVLRLATYELLQTKVPPKVVINEAIELGKLYGTEQSSKFINGILNSMLNDV